jgi:hypothetical protein
MVKFQRLIVPWKPLPLVTPCDVDDLADLEDVGLDLAAHLEAAELVVGAYAELPQAAAALDLRLGEWPASGLFTSAARLLPTVTCTAL